MPTEERINKVRRVLSFRQPDLRVVLEEPVNTHNASAVVRTCDAAGVLHVDVISSGLNPLPVNKAISTRAEKWLHLHYYPSAAECLGFLKKTGFKIVATHLGRDAVPHTEVDYTQPVALVFGNEAEGLSREALELADFKIKIPMMGMVQSLNLAVSVGIVLYEAMKQREAKGFFKKSRLSREELEDYFRKWLGIS